MSVQCLQGIFFHAEAIVFYGQDVSVLVPNIATELQDIILPGGVESVGKVVLDQWLQHIADDAVLQDFLVNIVQDLHGIIVTRTVDRKIPLAERQLLLQRDKGLCPDEAPENGSCLRNQFCCFIIAVFIAAGPKHIQRIVQEVWVKLRLKFLHFRFFVLELVVICFVDVLFQAFRHSVDRMGNIGKCSLIEVSADAVVQLVLAQCVQSVLNAAYLAVNRSHDQTKHHHTQRREQKNHDQQLRCIGIGLQEQFFPVDRVVNRAAARGIRIDHGIPFSAVRLEHAAARLKYFLGGFDVVLTGIVQKPPLIADDFKLQAVKRKIFFCKLLDLADLIAKQENAFCEGRGAACHGNRIPELRLVALDFPVNLHQVAFLLHLLHVMEIIGQNFHGADPCSGLGCSIIDVIDLAHRRIGHDPADAVIARGDLCQHIGNVVQFHRGQAIFIRDNEIIAQ